LLIAAITFAHYSTELGAHHYHVFYQGLYFLPVLLAGLWFGLRGGIVASLSITILYLPFTVIHWQAFSSEDFNNVMEIVLYNLVAVILGILRDREKKEQIRLREAESLAAIGKAASSLAHDMKTPLIAIGGFSRAIKSSLKTGKKHSEKLDIVIQETERLENMVSEMLEFSRPMELRLSKQNVQQVIRESLDVMRGISRRKHVELEVQSTQELPPCQFDAIRIKQVLINLLSNAIEASPAGETVLVSSFQKGTDLIIEVTDNGSGIPADKRKEVFQPFFSTKKGGTGLGLSIVKKIVEAHQGSVEVLGNLERGVIFRIVLPYERREDTKLKGI